MFWSRCNQRYILESDPDEDSEEDDDEDPEEDPTNYPADHDDEEEEPSGDDADDKDEEPIEGRRANYGFVESVEAEIRRRRAEDIGYGIRDTWIDPRDVAEEEALMTLKGVNTRVTELTAVQEQDTQDIYRVMEDTQVHFELQGYMTHTWVQDQRIDAQDTLIVTMTTQLSSLHGHLATALGEIRALQAREQARAGIGFENPRYFEKPKDLRPTLYDEKVIGLGYTPMFLTHSDEALEIKKFQRSRENKIEFAYDYENLNASYMNEKINFEDDYFQEIINPDFEKIDSPFQQTSSLKPYVPNVILEKIIIDLKDEVVNLLEKEKVNLKTIESLKSKGFELSENVSSESENQSENDCLLVEKERDKKENSKVIALGMFKLNVSQYASPISMLKSSCDSKNVEIKLKRKRHKRKSSKQNVKQVDNDVSRANNDFVHSLDLDTFSSVRRPKNSGVIWKKKGSSNTSNKKKGSSNTSNVGLSAISDSNLNKNVKMNDLLDDNNLFIFDDESVKISLVSKMPFRKKPRDSMNLRSKSTMKKSLPRTVHKWLPKMQP
nr:hypothetical protein [Tanacetum cinerariifolium]